MNQILFRSLVLNGELSAFCAFPPQFFFELTTSLQLAFEETTGATGIMHTYAKRRTYGLSHICPTTDFPTLECFAPQT